MIDESKVTELKTVNTGVVELGYKLADSVSDQKSCNDAYYYMNEIDRALKNRLSFIAPIVEAAHNAWKVSTERRREITEPLEKCKDYLARKIGIWKQMETERIRLEQERIRADMKKQAEETQLKAAVELEDRGHAEAAEAILEQPTYVPPVILPTPEGKTRTIWKFEIVREDDIPREYMLPDISGIGKVVRALGEKAHIPGIRIFKETKAFASSSRSE